MTKILTILVGVFFLITSLQAQVQPNLVISELLVVNKSNITDEKGQFDPWIEIYNPGSDSVNLGGMFASNNFANPRLWQIPKTNSDLTTIPPARFAITKQTIEFLRKKEVEETLINQLEPLKYRVIKGENEFIQTLRETIGKEQAELYKSWFLEQAMFSSFRITQQTLDSLRSKEVPDSLLNKLANLKDQEIIGEEEFLDSLQYALGEKQIEQYKNLILKRSILPNAFILLWIDGQPQQGLTHLNFKLDDSGDQIGLFAENGALIDTVTFGSQYQDLAYGRPEGGRSRFVYLSAPTPRKLNSGTITTFGWILYWTTRTDSVMWGLPMIVLLIGTGIILTLVTRWLQITHFWTSLKLIFSKESRSEEGKGDISPFAALMTALAATVGNGNIAGVATAIAIGGPGAPMWMWIAGLFGMATKYAEGFLGVHFREVAPNGTMAGGPMYYVKNGLKNKSVGKFLGAAFAACGVIACLIGTGNMAQSNSMAASLANTLNQVIHGGVTHEQAPGYFYIVIGIVIALLVGMVIIGGIKKIGYVSEKLVPAMIVFYIFFAMWVIIANFTHIPEAFVLIFESAFGIKPLIGATVGQVISSGVSRGLLSNEAGLGSAAIAQGASASEEPTDNGLIAMTGVFIDTILVNTMTTLTIVLTGAYMQTQAWQGLDAADNITSILVTQKAFESVIPFGIGGAIIAIASFLFGYTTLLGWSYYGEKCIEYLGGDKVIMPFRYTFIIFLFVGAVLTPIAGESFNYLNIVWNLGNIGNALMAVPNLVGLLFLAGLVARITQERLR